MSAFDNIQHKIQTREQARQTTSEWQANGEKIVFTNGCFDLLHYGHIHYLADAKDLGSKLIVGINSSDSVSRLKGPTRPINDDLTRLHNMAALEMVDLVVVFEEDTPLDLIRLLRPDVLVKGGDWPVESIAGAADVLSWGGTVRSLTFVTGYSTTSIESKIKTSGN
jgi:D-beta-D-heptose 7-phosphate kinase/D-beta-D-heptose 1-phosphate adenosyltransferase